MDPNDRFLTANVNDSVVLAVVAVLHVVARDPSNEQRVLSAHIAPARRRERGLVASVDVVRHDTDVDTGDRVAVRRD
jgi:hypothetical protein